MKSVCFGILLACFVIFPVPAKAGPAEDGINLYKQQNFAQALPKLKTAANANHPEAQFYLAWMYFQGLAVEQSDDEALVWLRKSAEGGNAAAMTDLGNMYETGRAISKDINAAIDWYRKAAANGNAQAMNNVGNAYSNGIGVEQSDENAVQWYQKASDLGHADAAVSLGLYYETGRGVDASLEEAARFYKLGAERGSAYGMTNYGVMLSKGVGIQQSNHQAAQWLRKAADKGFARAQYRLAELYEQGRGVPQSNREALTWYRKAAAQGWAGAQEKVDALLQKEPDSLAQSSSAAPRKPLITLKYTGYAKRLSQNDCERLSKDISHMLSTPSADRPLGQTIPAEAIQWALRHEQMAASGNGGCPNVDFSWPEIANSETQVASTKPAETSGLPLRPEIRARFWSGALSELDNGNAFRAGSAASDRCFKYDLNVARSCFSAGWMTEHRISGSGTLQTARTFYKKACNLGDAFSCLIYQRFVYENLGGGNDTQDLYLASDYAARLCNNGDSDACDAYHLSVLDTGYAVPPGRVTAALSYYQGHCSGAPKDYIACHNLAYMKQDSRLGIEDKSGAIALYDDACRSGAMDKACKAAQSMRYAQNQRDRNQTTSSGGLGGFLSDLGRGINIASEMGAAQSAQATTLAAPPRTAAQSATAQDWRDFDNAVRAINNTGTAFNSNCPASNPYC